MVKLTMLRPQVGVLAPMLGPAPGSEPERDKYRERAEPWRAWYRTARWRKLRMSVFVRDHFTCRECGRIDGNTSRLVCHHLTPHKGDEELFWDENNLGCVCAPCHDGPIKQRERWERA